MAIDLYNQRSLMEAVRVFNAPSKFLTDKFFSAIKTFPTKIVDVDIVKTDQKRRVSAYVRPKGDANNVEKQGFETNSYTPPLLKDRMTIVPDEDFDDRDAGRVIYNDGLSTAQRVGTAMGENLAHLNRGFERAEELQASEALFNGSVTMFDIDGDAVQEEIDYNRDASHAITLAGTDLWTDPLSNPLEDVIEWNADFNIKDSGVSSNIAILGTEAAKAFRGHEKIRLQLDTKSIDRGSIGSQAQVLGAVFIGHIDGVDYFTYNQWYFDEASQTTKPFVPVKFALLGSTNTRATRIYGAIKHLKSPTAAVQRFPWSWEDPDGEKRYLQLQSRPLLVTHEPDSFVVAQVVV